MKLFILALLILPCCAHARLGETEGQSQQRYGQPREDLSAPTDKPLLAGAPEKHYEFQGWRVRAAFAGGFCQVIEYARIPEGGVPISITDEERDAILAAESGLDETRLATLPPDKRKEAQLRRWRPEKIKEPGPLADIAKGIQGALKLSKWERADGAKAEFGLGLVLKFSSKDADDWERRIAREAAKNPPKPGQPGAKPAANLPKF